MTKNCAHHHHNNGKMSSDDDDTDNDLLLLIVLAAAAAKRGDDQVPDELEERGNGGFRPTPDIRGLWLVDGNRSRKRKFFVVITRIKICR